MFMENPSAGAGGLPPTGRFSPFSLPAIQQHSFNHDLSQMPEFPRRNSGHRRAYSEILTLPDDINFDGDLGVVGGAGPSFSDETEEDFFSMFLDMDKVNSSPSATSGFEVEEHNGGFRLGSRVGHHHSQSMDGSGSVKHEMMEEGFNGEGKKAVSAAKLAELALVDPKRTKRIWANRQSAARSKERKTRYIIELECKVQTLQTEATSLSAQLTLLQRDTDGFTAENSGLKIRLQTIEQQFRLQDALNDALKDEIQHLKMLTGQSVLNGGLLMNFPASYGANQSSFYPNNTGMQTLLTAQQFQQLQIHSQKQQFQQHQQLAPKKANLGSDPMASKD